MNIKKEKCLKKCENCGQCDGLVRPRNHKKEGESKKEIPAERKERLENDIRRYVDTLET